jgi:hypothetical protein
MSDALTNLDFEMSDELLAGIGADLITALLNSRLELLAAGQRFAEAPADDRATQLLREWNREALAENEAILEELCNG